MGKVLGSLVDIWSLQQTLPRAVAERKNFLASYLRGTASNSSDAKVLSVGCGAAREIRELSPETLQSLDISLLDSDSRAMDFALNSMGAYENKKQIKTYEGDIVRGDLSKIVKEDYDLVYSFGVLDYLPDKRALRMLDNMKKVVAQDGKIVYCIKDDTKYHALFYDLILDWRFVPRTREQGRELAKTAGLVVEREFSIAEGVVVVYECGLGG